jgi:hypothetical protein
MTQDKLLQSNERARLQKMTARLRMSQDDKAKMREKETIGRSLRDGMSPDEKAKMRETAKNTISRLRDTMSPDDKAKMREKETI